MISIPQNSQISRRAALGLGLSIGGGLAAPAIAQNRGQTWSLVTSWGRNAPGPGTTAQRLADRVTQASNGELTITLFAAGERVGGFDVFEAVSSGDVQLGHTASLFWTGKVGSAAAFFTTVPFGLTSEPYLGWLHYGGGQGLWDQLYAPFGLKPFMAGNSGMTLGGWFRDPVERLDDLAGLRIRVVGLGGAIYSKLGASTVSLPPAQIFENLNSGAIDAVEFLGPFSDIALGFHQAANNYYHPGFNKPNGPAEALVNQAAFEGLPPHLQQVIIDACLAESTLGTAEAWANNAAKLIELKELGVTLRTFPEDVMVAAEAAGGEVMAAVAAESELAAAIHTSYFNFASKSADLLAVTKASLLKRIASGPGFTQAGEVRTTNRSRA